MTTPNCWNRPAKLAGAARHGIDSQTGEPMSVYLSNEWFVDRCAAWDGVGIGQPTEEYPAGTPYPVAHGWVDLCRTCRWLPEGVL